MDTRKKRGKTGYSMLGAFRGPCEPETGNGSALRGNLCETY
jgi:hypothetical protein